MSSRKSQSSRINRPGHKSFAVIGWCVEDIQERCPEWDDKKCEEFLENFEEEIQLAMIEAGGDTIERLLDY